MRLRALCWLAVAAAAVVAAPARADWPNSPYVNLPVGMATGDQAVPSTLADGAGGAFIAWQDFRAGNYDVYLQHVSSSGAALWTANGVPVCVAGGDQIGTQLASDGSGGVIVAWTDLRAGNNDVYVQRLDATGTPLWTANGVALATLASSQMAPQLIGDGAGGAIVLWQDTRGGNTDVYAQRVDPAGVPQWAANGVAVVATGGEQAAPRLVSDGAGGAIVTWQDSRTATYDIYAQRINAAGVTQWTANGVALCTATANQGNPTIVTDGAGGAIVAWWDQRSGTSATDVYAQRVSGAGVGQWTANGQLVGYAYQNQTNPKMVSDGAGGAFLVWEDDRNVYWTEVFAQKIAPNGGVQWTIGGVELCTYGSNNFSPVIAADGAGGTIVAWWDDRDGAGDIDAQRVTAAGAVQWGPYGLAICAATGGQYNPSIVSDGAGGAIVAWQDQRSGNFDVYAQRVEHYGLLGNPEPAITSVRDVANDQGGQVRVSWKASYLDADPTWGIVDYRLWRAAALSSALAAPRASAARAVTSDPDEAVATGALWTTTTAGQGYAWEYVATEPAAGFAQYSLVAPTTSDSLASSNPLTAFLVEARAGTTVGSERWLSAPDSGYSVDNLAPGTPSALIGTYASGTTTLHWAPNGEADLAGYRLYRGSTADFVPDASNLVASPPDTGWADAGGSPAYYKLSAVDVHGNESGFALYSPGTTDAPGEALPTALALAPPAPNPAQRAATISFALPRAGKVSVVVFGPGGRAVRTLWSGARAAGRYQLAWNLKDDDGRGVPSGVYFVRLEAGGRALTRRLIAVR